MKILHTADIHIGDLSGPVKDGKNARRQDTINCIKETVRVAANVAERGEPIQVAIIAGDLFNRSRVWADTALEDIDDAIEEMLRPLCGACEHVVLLFGTENHDNPLAFNVIKQTTKSLNNLHIYTLPDVYRLETSEGAIQVLAIPGYDKGRLRAFVPDVDKETENRNATALINDVVLGLATKLDKATPSVMIGHYTVAGTTADNGMTFLAGQDVVILPQTIDSAGVTMACFGHIHRKQKLDCRTPAFYSGSINQLTFNDEGDTQGFYIHEIKNATYSVSQFHITPARRHYTIRLTEEDIAFFIANDIIPEPPRESFGVFWHDAIVRVRYNATAEQDKALNKAQLQKHLIEAGAFYVAEILPEDVEDGITSYEEDADNSPPALLHRYLENAETPADNMKRLEELAIPLIRKADDGREAGAHSGAFTPVRIEVRNYRSYTDAQFEFADIRMAMVNGANGVGKSSLFMDAIADCLFEKSRDEELGGWLRNGEKSGAVTFEFRMGDAEYRVVRTRTKSGKGTLAFNRKDDAGEWCDCGDTTLKLTQDKIEQVLGMDSHTFCSIALIRQDAYGMFLDTDSDRRMEVLSALLSLGIYSRLEELAKTETKNQRGRIASIKDRMGVLADQIAGKGELVAEEVGYTVALDCISAELEIIDKGISELTKAEALREETLKRADEKGSEANTIKDKVSEKENEYYSVMANRNKSAELASNVNKASAASALVASLRGELDIIRPMLTELAGISERHKATLETLTSIEKELKDISSDRSEHEDVLSKREDIENAIKAMEDIRVKRMELAPKMESHRAAMTAQEEAASQRQKHLADSRQRIGEIEARLNNAKSKTEILYNSGCPNIETATCRFLEDAQAAKELIPSLEDELQSTKANDKAEYERLTLELQEKQAKLADLGDPVIENQELTQRETCEAPFWHMARSLEAADAKIGELEKRERELRERQSELMSELQELTAKKTPLEQYEKRSVEIQDDINANAELAALLPECTAAAATVESHNERLTAMKNDIETMKTESDALLQAAMEIREGVPPSNDDELKLQLENKSEREERRALISQRLGGVKAKLEAVENAEEQTKEYRDDIQVTSQLLNDYQTLTQAFGLGGIQYMIIRGIVPEIMNRANEILAAMTGGRMAVDLRTEKELKSNQKIVNSLDVWIASLAGGSRPYNSHSGGEKVKIALAVTLALADIKARRAGAQLGMLFIDEPPFLDSDGTDAYADALNNIAMRNPAMRILAISHDPAMKARFPQNITVTSGESGSVVSID
jgi:exonuclease SbcC